MADILRFPKHDAGDTGTEFLQDDEILNFHTDVANGKTRILPLKASTPSKQKHSPSLDWSNQELATLFRVKHLLDTAGVQNEVDRGVTDEGDPWFVFCNPKGDVFIHLCRIRNVYILDSPNITSPLSGRDFNELIGSYTKQKLLKQEDQPNLENHRLVRLNRGGQILMHPSTMLAALIWTVFLASEEIVMIIPDDSENSARLVTDVDSLSSHASLSAMVGDAGLDATDDAGNDDPELLNLDASNHTKFGHNSYAIGLTAAAVSLGMMSDTLFSDDNINTFTDLISGASNTSETRDTVEVDASAAGNFLTSLGGLFKTLSSFDYADQAAAEIQEESIVAGSGSVEAAHTVFDVLQSTYQDAKLHVTNVVTHANIPFTNVSLAELADIGTEELTSLFSAFEAESFINDIGQDDISLTFLSQIDETEHLIAGLEDYSIGDLSMKATFDITPSDLDKAMEFVEASEMDDAEIISQSGNVGDTLIDTAIFPNDEQAQEAIEYALSLDIDLELIVVDGELIFIDMAALEDSSVDTVTFSWELSNGDTVSLIGLQSDFDTLDLIA